MRRREGDRNALLWSLAVKAAGYVDDGLLEPELAVGSLRLSALEAGVQYGDKPLEEDRVDSILGRLLEDA
jgi:hypothetical protein